MLLYHSVSDTPVGTFGAFTVSRAQLAAHLDLCWSRAISRSPCGSCWTASPRVSCRPRPVVLTFDDGFADFAANAWPLLTDRGLAATLYVTAGTSAGAASGWPRPGSGCRC